MSKFNKAKKIVDREYQEPGARRSIEIQDFAMLNIGLAIAEQLVIANMIELLRETGGKPEEYQFILDNLDSDE